jgi:hypothetical protein
LRAPPPSTFVAAPAEPIGLLVSFDGPPTHTHVGTTIFNNFEKAYSFDWNMQADLFATYKTALEQAGLTVVDLAALGVSEQDLFGVVRQGDGVWLFDPEQPGREERLRARIGVRVFLVVSEQSGKIYVGSECGAYGCTDRYAAGWGLYTRSFLGLDSYEAVPGTITFVATLDKPSMITSRELSVDGFDLKSASIPINDLEPKDFKNLSEPDWEPVRIAILAREKAVARALAVRISSGK